MTDHEQMIISALRYALGRRSYIMSCTEDYILKMLRGKVSENFVAVCIQDISEYYKEAERMKWDLKGSHDWKPLLEELKSKIV